SSGREVTPQLNHQHLVSLGVIGTKQMLDGNVEYSAWSGGVMQRAGDVIEWIAETIGQTPADVLREMHGYGAARRWQVWRGVACAARGEAGAETEAHQRREGAQKKAERSARGQRERTALAVRVKRWRSHAPPRMPSKTRATRQARNPVPHPAGPSRYPA